MSDKVYKAIKAGLQQIIDSIDNEPGYNKDCKGVKHNKKGLKVDKDQDKTLKATIEITIPYGLSAINKDEYQHLVDNMFADLASDMRETMEMRSDTFGTSDLSENWDSEYGVDYVQLVNQETDEVEVYLESRSNYVHD